MKTSKYIEINIANDFSEYPGARFREDGKHSGQEFLEDLLSIEFEKALKNNNILLINLDGTEGYTTSFLDQYFGGLARLHGKEAVLNSLEFVM